MKFYKGVQIILAALTVVGCHKMNVTEVTSKLRVGMSKAELDTVMKGEKFLKEQTVKTRPGNTVEETRGYLWALNTYEVIYPRNLITEQIPFDGSVKAYSYLVKEERRFANPIDVEALFIFVDQKKGEVIGWADIRGLVEVRLWDEVF
ncbi:MAG: hypothetical protein IPP35_09525 [Elusimicrobia bacterium]|nr:hypothetical protein [Elusimicrobiota bacterium]